MWIKNSKILIIKRLPAHVNKNLEIKYFKSKLKIETLKFSSNFDEYFLD